MTIEADATVRATWERLKARYLVLSALVVADERDGALAQANAERIDAGFSLKQNPSDPALAAAYAAAAEAVQAAVQRHMEAYWDPMHKAAQALFEAPAPDAEAVQYKVALLDARADVCAYAGEPTAFSILSADAARLLGSA
jgi:maltose-binding protein MalE